MPSLDCTIERIHQRNGQYMSKLEPWWWNVHISPNKEIKRDGIVGGIMSVGEGNTLSLTCPG